MYYRCFEGAIRTGWRNQMGHTERWGFGCVWNLEMMALYSKGMLGISSAPRPPVIASEGAILSSMENAGAPMRLGC